MQRYVMFLAFTVCSVLPAAVTAQGPAKVGEIMIVGGDAKLHGTVRKALQLSPGQALDDKALQRAAENVKPFGATVEVISPMDQKPGGFLNIVITLKQGAGKKEASKLEQLIAEALKNNPDIRVAETKLRLAEAEAARTRLKLISEITSLHADIDAAQASADEGKIRHDRAVQLYNNKSISAEQLDAALVTYVKLKADLASLQAKLPYLLGRNAAGGNRMSSNIIDPYMSTSWAVPPDLIAALLDHSITTKAHETAKLPISDEEFARRISLDILGRTPTAEEMKTFLAMPAKERREKWISQVHGVSQASAAAVWLNKHQAAAVPETPLTEKLRRALEATAQLDEDAVAPAEAFNYLREKALPGFNLIVRAKLKDDPITVKLREPVPVGAMLQFLEDELRVIFVLRDYGIVAVSAEERMPPGAVRVVDFWKQGTPKK